jgi:hypothetical protein
MKNLSFILILTVTTFLTVITLIVSSCKKDDNSTSPLVGNWKFIQNTTFATISPGPPADRYLKLNADGTVSGNYYAFTTYNVNKDNVLALTVAGGNVLKYGYKIKLDTLMLTVPGLCMDDCSVSFVKQN